MPSIRRPATLVSYRLEFLQSFVRNGKPVKPQRFYLRSRARSQRWHANQRAVAVVVIACGVLFTLFVLFPDKQQSTANSAKRFLLSIWK